MTAPVEVMAPPAMDGPVRCAACNGIIAEIEGDLIIIRRNSPELQVMARGWMMVQCHRRRDRNAATCGQINYIKAVS